MIWPNIWPIWPILNQWFWLPTIILKTPHKDRDSVHGGSSTAILVYLPFLVTISICGQFHILCLQFQASTGLQSFPYSKIVSRLLNWLWVWVINVTWSLYGYAVWVQIVLISLNCITSKQWSHRCRNYSNYLKQASLKSRLTDLHMIRPATSDKTFLGNNTTAGLVPFSLTLNMFDFGALDSRYYNLFLVTGTAGKEKCQCCCYYLLNPY